MNQNSFTEVTQESWLSRIGGAIKGFLVGLVLFGLAFPLLFWNEGRAVKRQKTLTEGAAAVVSVSADAIAPANAGKLVHVSGKAITPETLSDPMFGVKANAIHLQRVAEIYQWEEQSESRSQKKLGGGSETTTTYTYSKVWAPEPIDSTKFKQPDSHQNPTAMPCASEEWTAKEVRVGAFQLAPSLVNRINHYTPLAANTAAGGSNAAPAAFQPGNGGFYQGKNPASPEVGDVRVSFQQVEPAEVSIVAQQAGTTLSPYQTKAGGSIELLQVGSQSAAAMFQSAQQSNRMMTWIVRLIGFVVMFIGLTMVFKPLSVLADVVPIFGNIVQAGTGLIAFLAAAVLSFITIAVAWIVYRPVLGVVILAVAVGLAFALKNRLRFARRSTPATEPGPQVTIRTSGPLKA
jgi:hypothetical protein